MSFTWILSGPSVTACLAVAVIAVHGHHCHSLHRRDSQPHQLCVLHQLPVVRRHHRGAAVLPLEETRPVPTHQGTSSLSLVNCLCFASLWRCPMCPSGDSAGSCVLPDVLGVVAGFQSLLRTSGLRRRSGHHAHRCSGLLPGCPLERKTKMHLHLHRWGQGRNDSLIMLVSNKPVNKTLVLLTNSPDVLTPAVVLLQRGPHTWARGCVSWSFLSWTPWRSPVLQTGLSGRRAGAASLLVLKTRICFVVLFCRSFGTSCLTSGLATRVLLHNTTTTESESEDAVHSHLEPFLPELWLTDTELSLSQTNPYLTAFVFPLFHC